MNNKHNIDRTKVKLEKDTIDLAKSPVSTLGTHKYDLCYKPLTEMESKCLDVGAIDDRTLGEGRTSDEKQALLFAAGNLASKHTHTLGNIDFMCVTE